MVSPFRLSILQMIPWNRHIWLGSTIQTNRKENASNHPINLNHISIRQIELCQGIFGCASFIFVTIFVDIYKNPRRKDFFNPSYPKRPKIIKIKNEFFFFYIFWDVSKKLYDSRKTFITFLRHQKRSAKIKILCYFSSYLRLRWQCLLKLCFLSKSQLIPFLFP